MTRDDPGLAIEFSVSEQRRQLAERWDSYHQPSRVQPGDDAIEKPGLGLMNGASRFGSPAARVFRVWRMLNLDDRYDQMLCEDWIDRYAVNKLDCVVAYLSDDGTGLVFEPHELAQLMPPPAD